MMMKMQTNVTRRKKMMMIIIIIIIILFLILCYQESPLVILRFSCKWRLFVERCSGIITVISQVSSVLGVMVRAMTNLENNVVAAERVQEYVDIQSEVSVMPWVSI